VIRPSRAARDTGTKLAIAVIMMSSAIAISSSIWGSYFNESVAGPDGQASHPLPQDPLC
jgi:hypothetical protein